MTGSRAEHIRLQCQNNGDSIYLVYRLRPLAITNELLPMLGVKASRSGVKLMARIVLPLTKDPQTGRAVTFFVQGGVYSSTNRWQKLRIDRMQELVSEQVARLRREADERARSNPAEKLLINSQSAYMDYVFLDAYCGEGIVDVFMDSLEISGASEVVLPSANPYLLAAQSNQTNQASSAPHGLSSGGAPTEEGVVAWSQLSDFPPETKEVGNPEGIQDIETVPSAEQFPSTEEDRVDGVATQGAPTPSAKNEIRMRDSMLTINGTPIFVRAIRYRGEKLAFLHEIGFNTVWLATPPTAEMEAEALRLNMWFICPPPIDLSNVDGEPADAIQMDQLRVFAYNRVIAWDLGVPPTRVTLPEGETSAVAYARKQMRFLKSIPDSTLPYRPIIAQPEKDIRHFSTIYDVLLTSRSPLNSTLDFVSFGYWFRQTLNSVRGSKPLWSIVPTQHDPLLLGQWRQTAAGVFGAQENFYQRSGGNLSVPETLPTEQLRLMTYSCVMAGSRGLLFESPSRLDSGDQETVYRLKSLSLVNLELLMLEQWLSQGGSFATLPSNIPHVAGAVLATPHVRILIPLCLEPESQYSGASGASRNVEFIVRGLPSTYQCWKYSPDGLIPLPYETVAGGVKIVLDELPLVSTIVMTPNPTIMTSLSRRSRIFAPKMVGLMQEIADLRLRYFLQFYGSIELQGNELMWFERGKHYLEQSKRNSEAQDYSEAFLLAQRAMRPIMLMENRIWREKTASLPSPNFVPSATAFRSLHLLDRWTSLLATLEEGDNILFGGDFETIQNFKIYNWRNFQNQTELPGIVARAGILPEGAHEGERGLTLEIVAKNPKEAPSLFDSPPIMIQSPPLMIGPVGTIYEVEAWVNIPRKLVGSVEGLKISDTLSGDVLAERVLETNGWKKVSFRRIVKSEEPIHITISLSGYGKALVDNVSVRPFKSREFVQ